MRISFSDVAVHHGAVRALDGVAGELADGVVTAIIGPSGAGKSTLLRVLAGLERPTRGRVRFDDDDVTTQPAEARRLGVVFQDLRLFDFMSGRDNVGFAPAVAGLDDAERRRRVDEALALVRATRFADRSARVLSGGERQRIALGRALAMRPRALLLDEPFAALDADLRRQLRGELDELTRTVGITTLFVTHDRDDAFALAARIIVLADGKVAQAGAPAALYDRPASAYVATLLGDAALLPVAARDGERALVGGVWLDAVGAGARAVFRGHRFRLVEAGAPGWTVRVRQQRFMSGRFRVDVVHELLGALQLSFDAPPTDEELRICPSGAVALVDY